MSEPYFNRSVSFWRDRATRQGSRFSGQQATDAAAQTLRIESLINKRIGTNDWFEDTLDFGCGQGRFIPLLSKVSGHVWAVDILPELNSTVRACSINVSSITLEWPLRLPRAVDFMLAVFVFQHITDDGYMRIVADEIKRVLKPGARVLVLDNAQDKAAHVRPRTPPGFAALLGLRPGYSAELVTVNKRPNDHWLIDGIKT